eukprot:756073-Hanusia_phi.AAC.1
MPPGGHDGWDAAGTGPDRTVTSPVSRLPYQRDVVTVPADRAGRAPASGRLGAVTDPSPASPVGKLSNRPVLTVQYLSLVVTPISFHEYTGGMKYPYPSLLNQSVPNIPWANCGMTSGWTTGVFDIVKLGGEDRPGVVVGGWGGFVKGVVDLVGTGRRNRT